MTISAKVIADSISPAGIRLVTVQTRYPKFIHGELMTHRVFSRNASSSRAIPVARLIKDVEEDPVVPSVWGANQPGMQAAAELTGPALEEAKHDWDDARRDAIRAAWKLSRINVHKQIVNRILEPFAHINTLITATEWDNFFELRCHPAAQPEMRVLAYTIRDALAISTPNRLNHDQWHLPYVDGDRDSWDGATEADFLKLSVARCARVSYLTQEGAPPTVEADLALYDRLVGSRPLHASPAEHQAQPDLCYAYGQWVSQSLHGNFRGWIQHRKLIEEMI